MNEGSQNNINSAEKINENKDIPQITITENLDRELLNQLYLHIRYHHQLLEESKNMNIILLNLLEIYKVYSN